MSIEKYYPLEGEPDEFVAQHTVREGDEWVVYKRMRGYGPVEYDELIKKEKVPEKRNDYLSARARRFINDFLANGK